MDKTGDQSMISRWLKHWRDPSIQKNSVYTSLLVGSVLLMINHFDRFGDAKLSGDLILKSILTYIVPYLVASFSAVRSQLRLQSGFRVPQSGRYRCETCLEKGIHHDLQCKEGDVLPECNRSKNQTEFTLIEPMPREVPRGGSNQRSP